MAVKKKPNPAKTKIPRGRVVTTPAATSQVVMKPAEPPTLRPGPKSGEDGELFRLFADVRKDFEVGEWALVVKYASSHGYRVKRAIERGEIMVPGGPDTWEVRATGERDAADRVHTELYARRLK